MKTVRLIFLILFSLADVYCLYSVIGYVVQGAASPAIIGAAKTNFMGMYFMAITFSVLLLISVAMTILMAVLYHRAKKTVAKK